MPRKRDTEPQPPESGGQAPAGGRNTPPRDVWEALLRLRRCNKTQLAEALEVSPRTLRRWMQLTEAGEQPGAAASQAAGRLMFDTLHQAGAATYGLPIAWERITRIGGRR